MDTHNNQPHSENTPSVQDLAGLMDLDLTADDPVSGQHHLEESGEVDTDSHFAAEDSGADNDVFDDQEFNPEKNRTKVSLQNSGFAKAAIVTGGSLAVILGGMMVFQGQMPKEQVAQVVKKKDPADDKLSSAQAAATKAQQSESETKAQLALAKQKDSLAQVQEAAKGKPGQASITTDKTTIAKVPGETPMPVVVAPVTRNRSSNITPAAPSIQPAAKPTSIASIAKVQSLTPGATTTAKNTTQPTAVAAVPKSRPVSNPQPDVQLVASKSAQKPILKAISSPGIINPVVNNTVTKPTVDGNTELQQLAAVGRYGMVASSVEVPAIANSETRSLNASGSNSTSLAMVSNLPPLSQYFQKYAGQEPAPSNASNQLATSGTRTAFVNSQAILNGTANVKIAEKESLVAKNSTTTNSIAELPNPIRTLLVGTSAKGSAVTPVLWGAGANGAAKFLLKLDEPMLDGNNRQAFPAGTQFVVTAKPAATNIGLAELEVVSVIIQGMEFAPPSGSITIRDDQGGLLIGEDYFKRDEQIANRDIMSVFTGALGGVGRILNQPSSTVSSSVNGTVASTTNVVTNREPNILGGVLEGGFQNLSTVWSQRNQQAIQELTSKPNVYQIPKGRAVRVFVNQSMTF
jgi:Bacterial conjugation TrbI-like protein